MHELLYFFFSSSSSSKLRFTHKSLGKSPSLLPSKLKYREQFQFPPTQFYSRNLPSVFHIRLRPFRKRPSPPPCLDDPVITIIITMNRDLIAFVGRRLERFLPFPLSSPLIKRMTFPLSRHERARIYNSRRQITYRGFA